MHALSDIPRARILVIACSYEDADDLDHLRSDLALKLACGHLPDSGRDLCFAADHVALRERTQPARGDQADGAMVAVYCSSYDRPPASVTLDIDGTLYVVQAPAIVDVNAHHDERCFLPIHVYDTATFGEWWCCCGRARPRQGKRYAVICDARCVPPGSTGQTPTSPFAMTAICGQPRSDGLGR